ncbi:MAG: Hpt domain-containing protein [Leptospiraceae bacterium]|nr:Hpt domain-containing protein [Leptospiraceae bacterium]MCK6380387.1 Hpt domain-containing protein [Leptospiraceae bacterium]NUM41776.1 Hpt domain-containing protein [Leptospiraceae bacterium]
MLVNKERLNLLKDDSSEVELNWLKGLIDQVVEDLESRMKTMSTINSNNTKEIISELHKISGVAANFGLEDLHQKVSGLEKLAKNEKVSEAIDNFPSTRSIWEETKKELLIFQNEL